MKEKKKLVFYELLRKEDIHNYYIVNRERKAIEMHEPLLLISLLALVSGLLRQSNRKTWRPMMF